MYVYEPNGPYRLVVRSQVNFYVKETEHLNNLVVQCMNYKLNRGQTGFIILIPLGNSAPKIASLFCLCLCVSNHCSKFFRVVSQVVLTPTAYLSGTLYRIC